MKKEKVQVLLLLGVFVLLCILGAMLLTRMSGKGNSGSKHVLMEDAENEKQDAASAQEANGNQELNGNQEANGNQELNADQELQAEQVPTSEAAGSRKPVTRIKEEKVGEVTGDWETVWQTGQGARVLTWREQFAVWSAESGELLCEVPAAAAEENRICFGTLDEEGNIWLLCEKKEKKYLLQLDSAGEEKKRTELSGDKAFPMGEEIRKVTLSKSGIAVISRLEEGNRQSVYGTDGVFLFVKDKAADAVLM